MPIDIKFQAPGIESSFLYTLDGHRVVPCKDVLAWGKWMETADRIVKKTKIRDTEISTVFLGINHAFSAPPLLFETMVFGGKYDQDQYRTSTWEEAKQMHENIVRRISEGIGTRELESRAKAERAVQKIIILGKEK